MTGKPLICIVGCGRTAGFLIERLRRNWQLILIDYQEEKLESFKQRYGTDGIQYFSGDASSKITLQAANVHSAYQVLVTVPNDPTAKEISELLLNRFHKTNILTRINDPEIAKELRQKGVYVVNPFETMSNVIVNHLNLGETIAFNIGKGEGEIVQIALTQTSPVVGSPLRELPPRPWLIGAIYRPHHRPNDENQQAYTKRLQIAQEDELIIPDGNTVPQVGDKVILIGDPQILRATAQYLKAGAPVFPIRHGENIVSLFLENEHDRGAFREFRWLLLKMEPCRMLFVHNKPEVMHILERIRLPKSWHRAGKARKDIQQVERKHVPVLLSDDRALNRIGLVIYREPRSWWLRFQHRLFLWRRLFKALRRKTTPLYLIRNRASIKGVCLVIGTGRGTLQAAELAIDAALKFDLPLRVVQINPPAIIAGSAQLQSLQQQLQAVREVAALYGLTLTEQVREGNPVFTTLKLVSKDELMVFAYPKNSKSGFLIPNTARLLFKRFQGSIMCLAT